MHTAMLINKCHPFCPPIPLHLWTGLCKLNLAYRGLCNSIAIHAGRSNAIPEQVIEFCGLLQNCARIGTQKIPFPTPTPQQNWEDPISCFLSIPTCASKNYRCPLDQMSRHHGGYSGRGFFHSFSCGAQATLNTPEDTCCEAQNYFWTWTQLVTPNVASNCSINPLAKLIGSKSCFLPVLFVVANILARVIQVERC